MTIPFFKFLRPKTLKSSLSSFSLSHPTFNSSIKPVFYFQNISRVQPHLTTSTVNNLAQPSPLTANLLQYFLTNLYLLFVCFFLLLFFGHCFCSCFHMCLVAQLWLTFCNPMDLSLPGSSDHRDSPGKNTGVGCHAFLQGLFPTQDQTQVSCTAGRFFTILTTREALLPYSLMLTQQPA